MDQFIRMDQLKLDIIKEPRGFIRVLQFVFAICAFATTTNFGSNFSFTVSCKPNGTESVKLSQDIAYPFRFDHIKVEDVKACGNTYKVNYFGDYSSDAEFFVASGVLAMFYAMASLAFYCFMDAQYQENKTFPLVDFLVSMIIAVFWLSGSAAWASGLSSVKFVSDPNTFFQYLPICVDNSCVAEFAGNFAGLNISIIFGFLNFFLWAVNLWFLYKETSWFLDHSTAPQFGGAQSTPA